MQVVSYSDLNLGSRAGVALLYKRIQKAANEVCDNPPPRRQLRFVTERKDCSARALNRAVAQIGVPALDALHLAKTGHSKSAQVATNQ
jgi:UrcA family protein